MTLKVSSKTSAKKLAAAIALTISEGNTPVINTVGAGSLNQAVKAIAIARGYVAPTGKDLTITPVFNDITIEDEQKTCITLHVHVSKLV